jgi:hypothetical protein
MHEGAAVASVAAHGTDRHPLTLPLFAGLTIAATGGPLALSAALVPGLLGEAQSSAGLVVVLGTALFAPVLIIWLRYSAFVVSAGGLYSFVAVAVGPRAAKVHAALWVVSYALYLVYTVAYLAYDLLPSTFPQLVPYRVWLQLLLAVGLVAVVLLPVKLCVTIVAVTATAQLVLVGALTVVSIRNFAAPAASFVGHGRPVASLLAGGNTALLFICASLPLFLAGEVAGGSQVVRRGLSTGWAIVAVFTIVSVFPWAAIRAGLLDADVPGVAVARSADLPLLATVVGVGTAFSVLGVMAAEFLALTRLLHTVTRRPVSTTSRTLAAFLIAGSAVSLVDPLGVYADLLVPSLVALWLAQLIVFAAFPRFAQRHGGARLGDIAVSGAASLLMLFGLYSTLTNQLGS